MNTEDDGLKRLTKKPARESGLKFPGARLYQEFLAGGNLLKTDASAAGKARSQKKGRHLPPRCCSVVRELVRKRPERFVDLLSFVQTRHGTGAVPADAHAGRVAHVTISTSN